MTPKDKAKDLFVKMLETIPDFVVPDKDDAVELAKLHSLRAVDEIINSSPTQPTKDGFQLNEYPIGFDIIEANEFWQQVKTEIEQL